MTREERCYMGYANRSRRVYGAGRADTYRRRPAASIRSARRDEYILLSFIFPIMIVLIMMITLTFFISGSVRTEAASAHQSYKYYTSVRVEQGDTLWNIANENMCTEYNSVQDYIDEICTINHISENEIHAGAYITIPYYSADILD